jgi:hypothetical protein
MGEFRASVAGFFSRWQELKPKGAPNGNAALVLARLDEYSHQVEELQRQAQQYQRVKLPFADPPESCRRCAEGRGVWARAHSLASHEKPVGTCQMGPRCWVCTLE